MGEVPQEDEVHRPWHFSRWIQHESTLLNGQNASQDVGGDLSRTLLEVSIHASKSCAGENVGKMSASEYITWSFHPLKLFLSIITSSSKASYH
jgi:hypothetical protein